MGNLEKRSGNSPWEPPAQGPLHPEQDKLAASAARLALEGEKEGRVPLGNRIGALVPLGGPCSKS